MNIATDIYVGEEDGKPGFVEVEVERPGSDVGIHFRVDGYIVASAFLETYKLGVFVGQLSAAANEAMASA